MCEQKILLNKHNMIFGRANVHVTNMITLATADLPTPVHFGLEQRNQETRELHGGERRGGGGGGGYRGREVDGGREGEGEDVTSYMWHDIHLRYEVHIYTALLR